MKDRRAAVLWGVVVVALAVVVFANRDRIHFDWGNFLQQLKHIHRGHALAGITLTYLTYWLRAIR